MTLFQILVAPHPVFCPILSITLQSAARCHQMVENLKKATRHLQRKHIILNSMEFFKNNFLVFNSKQNEYNLKQSHNTTVWPSTRGGIYLTKGNTPRPTAVSRGACEVQGSQKRSK